MSDIIPVITYSGNKSSSKAIADESYKIINIIVNEYESEKNTIISTSSIKIVKISRHGYITINPNKEMILMKRIRLKMVRNNLLNIPEYSLPNGFRIRMFEKGDEHNWARIEASVNEFKNEQAALERFNKEFGPYLDEMTTRCVFIENKNGEAIGTTTAWYGDLLGNGDISGRIHWVGIVPAYQGRKLARPLLSAAMKILANHHSKAYLTSQTTSYQAINMYLNYGFEPLLTEPSCDEAWALLEDKLSRKIIN